jgi:hypothetical protein
LHLTASAFRISWAARCLSLFEEEEESLGGRATTTTALGFLVSMCGLRCAVRSVRRGDDFDDAKRCELGNWGGARRWRRVVVGRCGEKEELFALGGFPPDL